MLFWILTSALVAVIALLFMLALLRRHAAATPAAAYDVQVYRDQLADLEKDRQRGVIAPDEADRTRLEISRRMLEADRAAQAPQGTGAAPRAASVVMAGVVLAVLGGAFALYQQLGAAGLPDRPLKLRLAEADALYDSRPKQDEAEQAAVAARGPMPEIDPQFTELMERLRKAVADRPNDLRGLELLATNEMNTGNFRAGWETQRRLIALKGEAATAEDYARLGEFMTVAAGGLVTPEAEAALATAMEKDRGNGLALYYLGLMMGQNQRPDRAFRMWDALLRQSSPDAPWVPVIAENIEALAWLAGEENYSPPMPAGGGPSEADIAAAAEMTPEDRAAMIRGMVEQLNARLANEGGTGADWAKLISSLRMLGEGPRSEAVLAEARGKFADRPEDLAGIEAAAQVPLGEPAPPPASVAPESAAPESAAPAEPAGTGAAPLPGPSAEQMRDAAEMAPEDQQAMIEGMVNGLVERLTTEGGSPEEWARAISSLATLGKADTAREVLAKAKAAFADTPQAQAALDATAQAAGLAP